MLGSPILCLKGMKILMFQLSGFYYSTKEGQRQMSRATVQSYSRQTALGFSRITWRFMCLSKYTRSTLTGATSKYRYSCLILPPSY